MKIAFTTLGCPGWDLDTICARGSEYGFDGVDFRGFLDTLDITLHPAFTSDASTTKRKLTDAGLEVSGISSSIRIFDIENRQLYIDEARRTIDVARALGGKYIRVFGGGNSRHVGREQATQIGRDFIDEVLALDGARDLVWVFETHDDWVNADACSLLLEHISDPAFGALWDIGNTLLVAGEAPQETYAAIGPRIRYTHVKDVVYDPGHELAMDNGWRYVAPGRGQLPIGEVIAMLKQNGYDGWIVFEHEKRWHPELPEPEEIYPEFVNWVTPLIR